MPILKLAAEAQPTKRKGSARKVAEEAGNERYSKDQDLDRARSTLNEYTGYTSGKALMDYWEAEAAKHKDGLGRPLRSDAVIGYSVIIKPDEDSMAAMSEAEQLQFVRDSIRVTEEILYAHGLQVDMTALHRDERSPHAHLLGHDVEYRAGKKIGIQLYAAFNKTYPERMRALGYDVEDMAVYDPLKAAGMSAEDAAAYKADCISRKKKKGPSGRSSNQYKADREAELARREAELQAREQRLALSETGYTIKEKHLQEQYKALDEDMEELEAEKERLKAEKERFQQEREKSLQEQKKRQEEANKTAEDAKKALREAALEKTAVNQEKLRVAADRKELEQAKKGYEQAKKSYELAADKAAGIVRGFSLDTVERYGEALQAELERNCSQIRYSNGQTLWSVVQRPITQAVQTSIKRTAERTAPAVLQAQRERASRAERGLPSYTGPSQQTAGSSYEYPGY